MRAREDGSGSVDIRLEGMVSWQRTPVAQCYLNTYTELTAMMNKC
ncbi:hypothetical protein COLO4_06444 [Corchorus olitorius]|uniref:Uncharacterized protein n=1 Tax=Corchorus olitorius TaxID=93759 RepID=A0A1R3KN08_9ROSI|nr:hypothetical protein COLO4_06444 [Corchorus olitorius]